MATLSQLPDPVDLAFVAGDTFRVRIRVVDPNTTELLPLTAYEFQAWIAKLDRAKVVEFEATVDPESDDTAVILSLAPSVTATLPDFGTGTEFKGIWDLEVTFPNNDIRTVATGAVLCVLDVTNTGSP